MYSLEAGVGVQMQTFFCNWKGATFAREECQVQALFQTYKLLLLHDLVMTWGRKMTNGRIHIRQLRQVIIYFPQIIDIPEECRFND